MAVHDAVLRAARRICRERGGWTFTAEELVRALPDLNESSVRTHLGSRCCVNAPRNHVHRWPYFRRVARGRYELLPGYRAAEKPLRVAESTARHGGRPTRSARDTIHAVVRCEEGVYVAECLEIAVVTQGKTADEVLSNLQEAIALHLEGEDPRAIGLTRHPRLAVTYELPLARHAAET